MLDLSVPPLSLSLVLGMFLIFAMRLVDVSLGTIRVILVMRGMKWRAALIGFVEVSLWVLAVSQIMANLGNLWNLLAYSSGFAMGTLVGIWLESKLALGNVDIHILPMTRGNAVAVALRKAGYGVTELEGKGRSGNVQLIDTIASRRDVSKIISIATAIDKQSFITVNDMKDVKRGHLQLAK